MSSFVEVQGHKMLLDSRDSLGLSYNKVWEPLETELVRTNINPGGVALNVGANIGYYTLIFARLVGGEGKVFAFEPDPENFAILKKNIEINGYQNVVLVQKAVSNENGKTKLYLCEENKGDHRIYDSHDGRKSIDIEVLRLDDYFKDYNRDIDFIKIDIQGAEWGAVQGMINLLKKNKNMKIITEFWPIGLKRFGVEPEEYLKLLQGLGFKLFEVNNREKKIEPINDLKILEKYTVEKGNYTNIYGVF